MILESLFGLSLVLNVSLDPAANPVAWMQLSVRQKNAALLPLVRRATDCIVRQVSADPRYAADMRPEEFNDLIVDSIAACARIVRAMIDRWLRRGVSARTLSRRAARRGRQAG